MINETTLEKYLDALLTGDRNKSQTVVEDTMKTGVPVHSVYVDLIWPVMVEIEKLSRSDMITTVQEHLATRINCTIVNQLQNKLPRRQNREKKLVICCAQDQLQELGAQMMADLFESDGWEVRFIGGGLSNQDILAYVNSCAPQLLVIYGAAPRQAPDIRLLIDTIRGVDAWPDMRIMLSGGVFNRAEGLWEEIGADLFAENAVEALEAAHSSRRFNPENRTVKRRGLKTEKFKEQKAVEIAAINLQ